MVGKLEHCWGFVVEQVPGTVWTVWRVEKSPYSLFVVGLTGPALCLPAAMARTTDSVASY